MYQRQVSFTEAIKMALQQNYCNFSGRSSRSEYWWYCLFTFCLSFVLGIIFGSNSVAGEAVQGVVSLALLLPGLGLAVRRLHDTGRSGWWLLLCLTVIGAFVIIYWYCLDSQRGDNQYGPEPNMVVRN